MVLLLVVMLACRDGSEDGRDLYGQSEDSIGDKASSTNEQKPLVVAKKLARSGGTEQP